MLGKIEGRRREQQRMSWLDVITDSMDTNSGKLRDGKGQGGLCATVHGVTELDMT